MAIELRSKEEHMPHIKWLGIIKDNLGCYQESKLPDDAKKVDMPEDLDEIMVKSIPFCIGGIVIIMFSVIVKSLVCKEFPFNPIWSIIGFVVGFLALIIHELLHAVAFPKAATVYIGIYPKSYAAVALSAYPLKRWRFVFMSLLPTILGIVPIVLFLLLPPYMKNLSGFFLGMSMMGLTSPSVDLYNVYMVLRGTPKGCIVQFHGEDLYYYEENK